MVWGWTIEPVGRRIVEYRMGRFGRQPHRKRRRRGRTGLRHLEDAHRCQRAIRATGALLIRAARHVAGHRRHIRQFGTSRHLCRRRRHQRRNGEPGDNEYREQRGDEPAQDHALPWHRRETLERWPWFTYATARGERQGACRRHSRPNLQAIDREATVSNGSSGARRPCDAFKSWRTRTAGTGRLNR